MRMRTVSIGSGATTGLPIWLLSASKKRNFRASWWNQRRIKHWMSRRESSSRIETKSSRAETKWSLRSTNSLSSTISLNCQWYLRTMLNPPMIAIGKRNKEDNILLRQKDLKMLSQNILKILEAFHENRRGGNISYSNTLSQIHQTQISKIIVDNSMENAWSSMRNGAQNTNSKLVG